MPGHSSGLDAEPEFLFLVLSGLALHFDLAAFDQLAKENLVGQLVFDLGLKHPPQRTRPKGRIIALLGQFLPGFGGQPHVHPLGLELLVQLVHQLVHNALGRGLVQMTKLDDTVQTVCGIPG